MGRHAAAAAEARAWGANCRGVGSRLDSAADGVLAAAAAGRAGAGSLAEEMAGANAVGVAGMAETSALAAAVSSGGRFRHWSRLFGCGTAHYTYTAVGHTA